MTNDFDPADTPVPGDTQSTDNSQGKVQQAWQAWSSRPENNAALLQFGLAMLQPRSPGQTGLGQFANAVGQGAEASTRNVAAQEEAQAQAAKQDVQQQEADARTQTAGAYSRQVDQFGAGPGKGISNQIKLQQGFNHWLSGPEDATGLTSDPIVGAIRKQFPDIKSKADLLANPAALRAARQLFFQTNGGGAASDSTGSDAGGAAAPSGGSPSAGAVAPAAPPSPPGRPVFNKATGALAGYWYPDRGFVPNGQ